MASADVAGVVDGKFRLSISQIASEFGMARETVSKRLRDAGVVPDSQRNGYPVYRLRDVLPALSSSPSAAAKDPDEMSPTDRRAWYQAEAVKTDLEVKHRQLIPAAEHEESLAEMARKLVQFCETLPDVMERDLGLDGPQVARVETLVDQVRAQLYREMTE